MRTRKKRTSRKTKISKRAAQTKIVRAKKDKTVNTRPVVPLQQTSAQIQGEEGELSFIRLLLRMGIQEDNIFHNVYLKTASNNWVQIDIVVLTKKGLLCFEIKNWNGWIFGSETQRMWTQTFNYGKQKYRVYNPIMQNRTHVQALRFNLGDAIPIYSIIIFTGEANLSNLTINPKTWLIANTQFSKTYHDFKANKLDFIYNRDYVIEILNQGVQDSLNQTIVQQHQNKVKTYAR